MSSTQREHRRLRRLIQELDDEGVTLIEDALVSDDEHPGSDTLSRLAAHQLEEVLREELLYARSTPVHEGRRPAYGCIVFSGREIPQDAVAELRLIELSEESGYAAARPLANGMRTFVVRTTTGPASLAMLDRADELSLVRLAGELGCWIVQRHPSGAIRVFGRERLLIFENDEWSTKPYAHTQWVALGHLIGARDELLVGASILDFCLHLLSARHIGATIVWVIEGDVAALTTRLTGPRTSISVKLSMNEPDHLEALAVQLAVVDGACLVERNGQVTMMEAFLRNSDDAIKFVQPYGGTRHTSGSRFSFDDTNVVVFVVSADGPVTVFSDGVSVLRLDRVARNAFDDERFFPKDPGTSYVKARIQCPSCRKPLLIDTVLVADRNSTKAVNCPVCGHADVASRDCHIIETRVVKPWEPPNANVRWGWPVMQMAAKVANYRSGQAGD